MRSLKWALTRALPPAMITLALLAAFDLAGSGQSASRASTPLKNEVVLAFGPNGVLTRDGTLWVYRPDKGIWLTIDDSFAEEGHATHVLPLPVPATEIAQMQSFGFIVTTSGSCWFYDLSKDRWKDIGVPPTSD